MKNLKLILIFVAIACLSPLAAKAASFNLNAAAIQNTGIVNLSWSAPTPSALFNIQVLRQINGELTWTTISAFQSTSSSFSYNDSVFACGDSISYFIICNTDTSITKTIWVEDKSSPEMGRFDSVSIDQQTGDILLGWQPSKDIDTKGYIILKGTLVLQEYDTVFGINTTFYRDTTQDYTDIYRIRAIDGCENKNAPTSPAKTPFAVTASHASCTDYIHLEWTNATQSVYNLSNYQVFAAKNNGQPFLAATLDSSQHTYDLHNIDVQTSYTFFIRSINQDVSITASSVPDSIYIDGIPKPAYFSLDNLTAPDNTSVEISVVIDKTNYFKSCDIYAMHNDEQATLITSIAYANLTDSNVFTLPTSEHTKSSYCYFAAIVDTCNKIILITDTVCSIFLEGSLQDNVVNLSWNPYTYWDCSVSDYEIYRIANDSSTFIGTTTSGTNFFTDNIANIGEIYNLSYFVVAVKSSCPASSVFLQSKSNEVPLINENEIPVYLSTGFYPQGTAKIFKPFYVSKAGDKYEFYIYDRFGGLVYKSNDPNEGWDGTKDRKLCIPGIYGYIVKIERNGHATTVRNIVTLIVN